MTQTQGEIPKPSAVCPKCAAKYGPSQVFCEQCGSRLALKDTDAPRKASDPVDFTLYVSAPVAVEITIAFPDMKAGMEGRLLIGVDRVIFQGKSGPDCVLPMWEVKSVKEYHVSVGIFNRVTTWYVSLDTLGGMCSFRFLPTGNEKQDARKIAGLLDVCRTSASLAKARADLIKNT